MVWEEVEVQVKEVEVEMEEVEEEFITLIMWTWPNSPALTLSFTLEKAGSNLARGEQENRQGGEG